MSRTNRLVEFVPPVKGQVLERTKTFKLLGTLMNENQKWTDQEKEIASSGYAVLSILRKSYNPDDNNFVCYPLPLQRT